MKNLTLKQNWSKTNQNMRKEWKEEAKTLFFRLKRNGKIGRENLLFLCLEAKREIRKRKLIFFRSEYPNRNQAYWIETKCTFIWSKKCWIEKKRTNIYIFSPLEVKHLRNGSLFALFLFEAKTILKQNRRTLSWIKLHLA